MPGVATTTFGKMRIINTFNLDSEMKFMLFCRCYQYERQAKKVFQCMYSVPRERSRVVLCYIMVNIRSISREKDDVNDF